MEEMNERKDRLVLKKVERHNGPIRKCMNKIEHWKTCNKLNNTKIKCFINVTKEGTEKK